jgi:peptidoglycan/LPS O-acetylase OafA/YrhL
MPRESHLISSLMQQRDNNFNFIRLFAASLVLFSHAFALSSGKSSDEPLRAFFQMTLGQVAVDVFFICSGLLITKSLTNSASMLTYVRARCLRILPALWLALLLTVVICGLFFTSQSPAEFFSNPSVYIYLLRNSVLITGIEHRLLDVFSSVPYSHLVNASLWTLPYEVAMYIGIAILWLISTRTQKRINIEFKYLVLAVAIVTLAVQLLILDSRPSNLVRLTACFFCGASAYLFREYIKLNRLVALGLATVWLLSLWLEMPGLSLRFYTLCVVYVTLCFALIPAQSLQSFNRLGDYSYGVYIYAWPVQQMLAAKFVGIGPWEMFLWSFVITMSLASISWHCIEKRALSLKQRSSKNIAPRYQIDRPEH